MKTYDVIVVGAGPSGGQCARELAANGFKVLLTDKAKGFWENNYSSGGGPLSMMSDFHLPSSIVGSYWNKLNIESTREKNLWTSDSPFGPILDFDRLRQFLSDETVRYGGDFQLGLQYLSHCDRKEGVEVTLKNLETHQEERFLTRYLIDGTGTDRKVIGSKKGQSSTLPATGIEFHIKVAPDVYQKYSQTLNFFLGHRWMPQGYAWIFPMAHNQLKVGVIRYFQNKKYVPFEASYQYYLDQLLEQCGPYELEDRHGKTIQYTAGQRDTRYSGNVVAIGDAISCVNPLGWEGIRHALFSGRAAAKALQQCLANKNSDFTAYQKELNSYFGYKWFFSELLMRNLFTNKSDALMDSIVKNFGLMDNREIIEVIFNYKFSHSIKSYFWYYLEKFGLSRPKHFQHKGTKKTKTQSF